MEMVKRLCGEYAGNCVAIILRLSRDCVGVVKGCPGIVGGLTSQDIW